MTEDQFRRIALSMPGAAEGSHMGHPDFRTGGAKGKIFASIYYEEDGLEVGMAKLTPAQQSKAVKAHPKMFSPVPGGWGRGGATRVHLQAARVGPVREALQMAWEGAPSKPPARAARRTKRA